jgi:sarcosine oxidase subunit beta
VKVAVVGAGITGLSVALFLAEAGVETVVLERNGVGAGASGVQPGGVRQQWSTRVNVELARESLAFYRELDERLGFDSGARFDECGYLFLAHSADALSRLSTNVSLQNELGVTSRIVAPEEAAELVPGLDASALAGGAWCAEDGYVDRPQTVVEAFARAAAERGAALERADVRHVGREDHGWWLATAAGTVRADAAVVAAGCDTPAVVAPLGIELPIAREPRHLFLSEPLAERLLEPLVVAAERRFAAKQLASGRVLASDLGAAGDPDERREEWRANVRARIDELLPILSFVPLPLLVSGEYDMTPDHQPIVGEVADGLWLAAGFSGHGFMLAPAVSRRLAAAVAGAPLDELLGPFAPDRFAAATVEAEREVV